MNKDYGWKRFLALWQKQTSGQLHVVVVELDAVLLGRPRNLDPVCDSEFVAAGNSAAISVSAVPASVPSEFYRAEEGTMAR